MLFTRLYCHQWLISSHCIDNWGEATGVTSPKSPWVYPFFRTWLLQFFIPIIVGKSHIEKCPGPGPAGQPCHSTPDVQGVQVVVFKTHVGDLQDSSHEIHGGWASGLSSDHQVSSRCLVGFYIPRYILRMG